MPSTLYVVSHWSEDFENSKSRQLGNLNWVFFSNKVTGKKFQRLVLTLPDLYDPKDPRPSWGDAYAALHVICGLASTMERRGILMDRDGPLTLQDIAAKTCRPIALFERTLPTLVEVQCLEKYEIEFENGAWKLPDQVAIWARKAESWRSKKARETGSGSNGVHPQSPGVHPQSPGVHPQSPGVHPQSPETELPGFDEIVPEMGPQSPGVHQQSAGVHPQSPGVHPQSPGVLRTEQNRTEQNRTEQKSTPLPSPQTGDKAKPIFLDRLTARRFICEKILGGRDPTRSWSSRAEERFVTLLTEGISARDINVIAWFRNLPLNEEIPELKARRAGIITETALMEYWYDELARASAYAKKKTAGRVPAENPWPPRSRDFIRAQFPEVENFNFPARFDLLPADVLHNWEKNHEEWERNNPLPEPQTNTP